MEWIIVLAAGLAAGAGFGWCMASRTLRRSGGAKAPADLRPAAHRAPDALGRRARGISPDSIQAPKALDPQQRRQRIQDRYVAARFAGSLKDAKELHDATKVIKAARLYFEDEKNARGDELLRLAIAATPQEPRLWLARLEILFLAREAGRFMEAARAFKRAHPFDPHWPDVTRLGHALAPEEPLFNRTGEEADRKEHYGPWPNTPNWIEAPWDLTAEIAGSGFHRSMRGKLQRLLAAPPRFRQAGAR